QFPGYKVDAMSGFRRGDPRFHGKGLATDVQLTDLASGKLLGNYQDPASFSTYERFAQTARGVQMRDYPELADKFRWGGYFGGPKGKYGAMDTMHFDLGGAGMGGGSWENGLNAKQQALWPTAQSNGAVAQLDKLAKASGDATINLGELGKGVGSLGSTLQSIPQAMLASGGGTGIFAGLSKFGMSLFSSSGQFASAWMKGGIGLYADGTEGAPGGLSMVGERGREFVNLPRGSQVIPNHRTESMIAANRNSGGGGGRGRAVPLNVNIIGASGDEHVRQLVQQGVSAGLELYSKEMERSGSGTQQQRYALRRG
ncbi:MAG: hypothetical protein J7516_17340, partial [Shinella sp.]|nr:hypothetical protein [Shinella sp.]